MAEGPDNVLTVRELIRTSSVQLMDVACGGTCQHRSASECATATHFVYTYGGAFVRHVGRAEAVGNAANVLVFNNGQEYQVSHPTSGGDRCLSIKIEPSALDELCEPGELSHSPSGTLRSQSRNIDAGSQLLVATLVKGLRDGTMDAQEAETRAFALVKRSFGGMRRAVATKFGRAKLVHRAKLTLAEDPGRRWTLGQIAAAVGVSPVYLAQVFSKVEGVSLYRYQLELRMAGALHLLRECDDLTELALACGFSSHSHFTHAFRKHFGRTPSAVQSELRTGKGIPK